jgi:hypothetical protein
MNKQIISILLPILLLTLSAATFHKYHMALYQIDYAPEKKMLQITSRIHIEDLNKALSTIKKNISIESDKESTEDLNLLIDYLSTRFSIKVNGQLKTLNFLSKEIDGDELVCYFSVKGVSKINTLEIYNTILTEIFSDQQNRINVSVLGIKNSFIYTKTINSKIIKY